MNVWVGAGYECVCGGGGGTNVCVLGGGGGVVHARMHASVRVYTCRDEHAHTQAWPYTYIHNNNSISHFPPRCPGVLLSLWDIDYTLATCQSVQIREWVFSMCSCRR